MNHGPWLRPTLVAASVLALGAVAAAGVASPLRPLLTVWFLLFCPGLALAPLLRLGDGWNQLAVAIPLSIALDILVASAFMYAGAWSAPLIVAVLAAISLLGAALQVRGWRVSR
jgi:uncharacterized membrane protein